MSVTTTSLASRSGSLGIQLAGHLLRRTSFRFTKPRVDELEVLDADAAVDNLFNTAVPTPYIPRPLDYDEDVYNATGGEWIDDDNAQDVNEGNRRQWVATWWLRNAIYDPSATHKLAFFIHTFFTTSYEGISGSGVGAYQLSRFFYDHLALLNYAAENSMGLKTLAKKMTLDNFMLCYLNNRLNRASGVNENYAREFLELFTIGIGDEQNPNYTEEDITKVAQILTGFTTKLTRNESNVDGGANDDDPNPTPATGIFKGYALLSNHDTSDKTFSEKFGETTITGGNTVAGMYQELEDLIDMVFAQEATARNYARKMYRFYVDSTITQNIEDTVITDLADDLIANNYDLVATLKLLLKSEHFYSMCNSAEGGGNIIKSPIEILTEAMSFFNTDLPALSGTPTATEIEEHFFRFGTAYLFNKLGEDGGILLFGPNSVAGYPAYYQEPLRDKNWYNGTTIPTRYTIGELFVTNQYYIDNILHTNIDSVAFANYLADILGVDVGNANDMLDAVLNYLLPRPLSAERRDIIKDIFLGGIAADPADAEINWQCEWGLYHGEGCNVAPDVPPDGDEDRVRPHLNALVVAVLSAQEFQLK